MVRVALDERVISVDPTAGVRVPRDRGRTHEPWTYLRPAEVVRLLRAAGVATVEKDRGGVPRKTNGPEAEAAEPLSPHVLRVEPDREVRRERVHRFDGPPTTARRTALVKLVHPEDADAARVAIYTGLREGELWTLHLEDVDLEAGRIVVRYGGGRGEIRSGGRSRRDWRSPRREQKRGSSRPPRAKPRTTATSRIVFNMKCRFRPLTRAGPPEPERPR